MIRVLIALALPTLALAGAAVSLAGKGFLSVPRGELMLVASSGSDAEFQPASFEEGDCGSAQLFAKSAPAGAGPQTGARVISFALPAGAERIAVVLQEIPAADPASGPTLVLAVDANGRILAVSDDLSAAWRKIADSAPSCPRAPHGRKPSGSV